MELSTNYDSATIVGQHPLAWVAIICAVASAAILVWYLIRRPPLERDVKVWLLLGIGVFPLGAAGAGNIVGFQHTMTIDFCSGCHVMTPYTSDARNPESETLPAMHTRNVSFGGNSCYTCHADYGMFGTVTTKLAGVRHLYEYYDHFSALSVDEALPTIRLYDPFPNSTCMRCHTTTLPSWTANTEHASIIDDVRSGAISCASEGCHGPAHPFSKRRRGGGAR